MALATTWEKGAVSSVCVALGQEPGETTADAIPSTWKQTLPTEH